MDEAVITFYRRLLRNRFEHAGSFENASIFLESHGGNLSCATGDFMEIYINVINSRIDNIKYTCSCAPAANVAVEILCTLVKGKTLDEAAAITEESFFQALGTRSEDFTKKVRGLLELLKKGISDFKHQPEKRYNK